MSKPHLKAHFALFVGLAALVLALSCLALLASLTLTSAHPLPGAQIRTQLYQLPNANVCSYVFKFKVLLDKPLNLSNRHWTLRIGRASDDVHLWSEAQDYFAMVGGQVNIHPPLVRLKCL